LPCCARAQSDAACAWNGKEETMKKTMHLIRKPLRVSCIWVATGDTRMPLKCVWRTADEPAGLPAEREANQLEMIQEVSGRIHLCA
jgi:hypothetical protein